MRRKKKWRALALPASLVVILLAAAAAALVPACTRNDHEFGLHGDDTVVGALREVTTSDPLAVADLARRLDVGVDELKAANPKLAARVVAGTKVRVPAAYVLPPGPRHGIVVNIAEPRLYFYPGDDADADEVVTFPVAVGREEWETPTGSTTIVERLVDPKWYPPESIREEAEEKGQPLPAVVPAGEENPLGKYALRLAWGKHLIHGTNHPDSVGKAASHGCIRLYPEDMEALFGEVKEGTPVTLVDAPYKLGVRRDAIYLEAHAVGAGTNPASARARLMRAIDELRRRHPTARIDESVLLHTLAAASGVPVKISKD